MAVMCPPCAGSHQQPSFEGRASHPSVSLSVIHFLRPDGPSFQARSSPIAATCDKGARAHEKLPPVSRQVLLLHLSGGGKHIA
eukprot:3554076-Amphidinium_carterae.2